MYETLFDIFRGLPGKEPKLLESVRGFNLAQQRMKQFAAEQPGAYFIFNAWNCCVVLQVDTLKEPLSKSPGSGSADRLKRGDFGPYLWDASF